MKEGELEQVFLLQGAKKFKISKKGKPWYSVFH